MYCKQRVTELCWNGALCGRLCALLATCLCDMQQQQLARTTHTHTHAHPVRYICAEVGTSAPIEKTKKYKCGALVAGQWQQTYTLHGYEEQRGGIVRHHEHVARTGNGIYIATHNACNGMRLTTTDFFLLLSSFLAIS